MHSTSNVRLAEGFDHALVLAPMADDYGAFPGPRTVATAVGATLIEPDAAARQAIGPNLFDVSRYAAIVAAGTAQGGREAPRAPWRPASRGVPGVA